jgi:serine/threonine protein kinase
MAGLVASRTEEGKIIAGRYTLLTRLGSGGMGVVWKAHDQVLGRDVAIKEVSIPHEVAEDERSGLYTRAMREARAAARLGHPNSVTVFDVHEEEGRPMIVMEYVEGETLQEHIRNDGPLDPRAAAKAGLAVLDALERAHVSGIVHRDVKPGNIMITEDGTVKLADFGIAAVKDDPRITQTGVVLGSPSYLSPEQARGEEATPATDLWSLGASLYFAVEGEPPFDRGNAVATVDAVVHEQPRPTKRAHGLGGAIDRLLAKELSSRPSYDEARRLLESAYRGGAGSASTQFVPATQEEEPAEPEPETFEPEPREKTGRAAWWVAALLLLAGLAVGATLLLAGSEEDSTPQAEGRAGEDAEPAGNGGGGQADEDEGGGQVDVDEGEAPAEAPAEEGTVPADWTTYTDPQSGYTVSHPPDWSIETGNAATSNTDFVDPDTGAYMRVAWRSPPDPAGAQGAWEDYEPVFADRHAAEGYQLLGIEPYEYRDYDAALWEYTYGGSHAVNLGFVTGDFGFALNFQTPEDEWDDMQDEFEAFKASFQPPG